MSNFQRTEICPNCSRICPVNYYDLGHSGYAKECTLCEFSVKENAWEFMASGLSYDEWTKKKLQEEE